MINHGSEIKLFSGSSNRPLAEAIASKLNTSLGEIEITHFCDGEIYVRYNESIRGKDVFLIQSTSSPVNNNLMELQTRCNLSTILINKSMETNERMISW